MPNHLSNLGIFHTAISILALIFGLIAIFRNGKIDPRNNVGKWYVILTIVTCLTSFPIMKTGHFTPAHILGVLVLVLLGIGLYGRKLSAKRGENIEIIFLSATLFLSFIPAITETLTRLPISGPIAESPDAGVIKIANITLTVVFGIGLFFQLSKLRKSRQI